jgi:transmembrane sensor
MQPDHTSEIDLRAPVSEQGSGWWVLLNEGEATPAHQRAFAEWVSRSPERVAAYLQAARLALALGSADTRWPDTPVDELIREAKAAPREVASLPLGSGGGRCEAPRPRGRLLPRLTRPAAIASVAMAAVVSWLYWHPGPQRLETAVGEQRSVLLSDGSLVTLNTSSAIEVQMTQHHRTVRLLAGEVLFKVAHDATRPFDVMSGNATVRAVGTQFDVDRRPDSTTVTVVDGRVAVFTGSRDARQEEEIRLPLQAGEQLTLLPRSARRVAQADVEMALAWTQRKLIFQHRPLEEVAGEFNRYNRELIEIRSPELRSQEVTGVFQANDPASFLTFLSGLPGVSIERSADGLRVVVRQAQDVPP